ncbi:MAG: hypothetical protein IID35_10100, partial [Planctomycetes bacterium]|nr:hypothetical protein [Planctomycetota bacterium]
MTSSSSATSIRPRGRVPTFLLVFAVALAARAVWAGYRMSRGDGAALEFPDEAQYWAMAKSLAASGGLVDEFGFRATRMPLFPNWLAIFVQAPRGVVFAKIAHVLIGALCAVLTCGFASALAGRRAGLLAGLLVALDPF